ncbi:MAG: hypothetical protein HY319_26955 [Armatimonadetes bacterium]|nr:hypothetical protein [Armatimonadota bacterium]
MRPRAVFAAIAVSGVLAAILWWCCHPRLIVYVDPSMLSELDLSAYRRAFHQAGVVRLTVVSRLPEGRSLGDLPHGVAIEVVNRSGRNPLLDAESLALGLTGPGHTQDRTAVVYPEEIDAFLKKYRDTYARAGSQDWGEVRTRLVTNTAVHESWHAITRSHSHNPRDKDSVMFIDPGKACVEFGTQNLRFTLGHRDRLQEIFAPAWSYLF